MRKNEWSSIIGNRENVPHLLCPNRDKPLDSFSLLVILTGKGGNIAVD
jgi:hypothetical protein